ncbi:MAG: hypothetical protein WC147_00160 [Syntrophomonas sp.]
MKNFMNRVEKGLIRLIVLTIMVMVAVQGLMTVDPIRFYLSWGERMEGQTIQMPVTSTRENAAPGAEDAISPQARVIIEVGKFSSLPRAKILINGQEKYNFSAKRVTIEIDAGDTVEIDSTAYNFPIEYEIAAVSSNLAYPKSEQTFTANQTVVMVGKIIVK